MKTGISGQIRQRESLTIVCGMIGQVRFHGTTRDHVYEEGGAVVRLGIKDSGEECL